MMTVVNYCHGTPMGYLLRHALRYIIGNLERIELQEEKLLRV